MRKGILWAIAVSAALAAASAASANSFSHSYLTPDGRELGLIFDEVDGLGGRALLRLDPDGTGNLRLLEILLTNTSSAVPADRPVDVPADLILTSLYVDWGAPGLAAGDPLITGGSVRVADGSQMVGKKIKAWDDLSAWWGFANYQYTEFDFLGPNFISSRAAHTEAFASGGKLNGPDYGLASAEDDVIGLYTSQPAAADTVVVRLNLDADLTTLAGIVRPGNHQPFIEFGSNYEFFRSDCPPILPPEPPPQNPEIPEPLTAGGVLLGVGTLLGYLRRRTRHVN